MRAKIFRGAVADSGKQFHHAFEGDFIARIGHEADERRHVFDVRLLEKPDAAGDLVRNAAPRKLQLQLERVIMRAVKDRDVVQINIFIAQLENPLGNKLRLFEPSLSATNAGLSVFIRACAKCFRIA
jgi:hypothetical protein